LAGVLWKLVPKAKSQKCSNNKSKFTLWWDGTVKLNDRGRKTGGRIGYRDLRVLVGGVLGIYIEVG